MRNMSSKLLSSLMLLGACVFTGCAADAEDASLEDEELNGEEEPTGSTEQAASARLAPSCVATGFRRELGLQGEEWWISNQCRSHVRVKAIVAYGGDGPCTPLAPGQSTKFRFMDHLGSRFDRLVSC